MAVRSLPFTTALPRLERRYVIAGLLAALAGTLVLLLTQPPERTPVLTVARDLPAGHRLVAGDTAVRYVEDPRGHVEGDSLGSLTGYSLAVPLRQGEPLIASALEAPALVESPRRLSVAVPLSRAALGRIAPGDRIDVYATGRDSVGDTVTRRIAAGVYVIESSVEESGGFSNDVSLLLAVDEEVAVAIANASHVGELDIVVVNG